MIAPAVKQEIREGVRLDAARVLAIDQRLDQLRRRVPSELRDVVQQMWEAIKEAHGA